MPHIGESRESDHEYFAVNDGVLTDIIRQAHYATAESSLGPDVRRVGHW